METTADAVSYQALQDLAVLWPQKYADVPVWQDFAPAFLNYRRERERHYVAAMPPQIQDAVHGGRWQAVSAFLRRHQEELDADPFSDWGYALRSLGASALLSQEVDWKGIDILDALVRSRTCSR